MSLKTPLKIWIAAVASSVALAAGIVTFSTVAVHADARLSRPAETLPPTSLVASPTPADLAPEQAAIKRGDRLHGLASWYGGVFNGRKTASGERFDMNAMTACHPTLPFGSEQSQQAGGCSSDYGSRRPGGRRADHRPFLWSGRKAGHDQGRPCQGGSGGSFSWPGAGNSLNQQSPCKTETASPRAGRCFVRGRSVTRLRGACRAFAGTAAPRLLRPGCCRWSARPGGTR